jgi:hypothetical protein
MMTGPLVNWHLATCQNPEEQSAGDRYVLNFWPVASSQWPVGQVIF